jgi:hypothetical protein
LGVVVKEEMVMVAKGKLLNKEQIAKEKRKALDVKSAGTQHRHPRGKSPAEVWPAKTSCFSFAPARVLSGYVHH